MKVFRTTSMDVTAECWYWFGLLDMETLITKRKPRFLAKYVQPDNVYVNCSIMLRVCNMWQFFFFSFYLLYLCFSCLLPINLVNKVDYVDK